MSINIICAVNESYQIGNSKTNDLLYKISGDLQRFKELTLHSYVLMGRNTFESLPKPLKDRTNVVFTGNKKYKINQEYLDNYDIRVEHDFHKVINHYNTGIQDKELNIIGGSYLFAEGLEYADNIYLTMIHDSEHPNGDIYFPKEELENFIPVAVSYPKLDEVSGLKYTYIHYKRNDKYNNE